MYACNAGCPGRRGRRGLIMIHPGILAGSCIYSSKVYLPYGAGSDLLSTVYSMNGLHTVPVVENGG